MRVRAYIGIGSNLGDRLGHCRRTLERLSLLPDTTLTAISPFFETEPQEGVEGGLFLNGVAEIATDLSPRRLLIHLQEIETALGRPSDHAPGAARPVDLDILLYGEVVLDEPGLVIPHPRMTRRRFVLAPLAAIAPGVRHPLERHTAAELLRRLAPGAACPAGAP
jgi:2-amino-4-hydroxy-6-hydroxymethyldihydropteridine diphosphokinase